MGGGDPSHVRSPCLDQIAVEQRATRRTTKLLEYELTSERGGQRTDGGWIGQHSLARIRPVFIRFAHQVMAARAPNPIRPVHPADLEVLSERMDARRVVDRGLRFNGWVS